MDKEKLFINNAREIVPSVNDSSYKRILAVGDIHGKFNELKSLWRKLSVTDNDLIIFLGDYIDRGENVAAVLDWVINQPKDKNFIFLRGNHEQMMLDAFEKDREFLEEILDGKKKIISNRDAMGYGAAVSWLINGGQETLRWIKVLCKKNNCTIDDLINFIKNFPLSYSIEVGGQKYFFCHAGVEEGVALEEQDKEFLLWAREKFFNHYSGKDVIISGHSPIKLFFDFDSINPRPIKIPDRNILMVDTGAFIPGGRLSAVDILSGEIFQSGVDSLGDIIFVCEWNTCRSAMAKYIMRYLLKAAGLAKKISVDSAGCTTDGGEFLGRRTRKTLLENKIPVAEHISKHFTAREYQNFKIVIALDKRTLQLMTRELGDPDKKIRLLKDFDGNEISVADPGFLGEHEKAFSEIYLGCQALLKEIVASSAD